MIGDKLGGTFVLPVPSRTFVRAWRFWNCLVSEEALVSTLYNVTATHSTYSSDVMTNQVVLLLETSAGEVTLVLRRAVLHVNATG